MKSFLSIILLCMVTVSLMAQSTLTGKLLDDGSKEPLIGATIIVKSTGNGTATGLDGSFKLDNVPNGDQELVVSYIGYNPKSIPVTVKESTDLGNMEMSASAVGLNEVQVVSNIAVDRKTPVAAISIKATEIEEKLGSQEFPEIMKRTPSIYATKSRGGFGDSRINIRGFAQEDVALLINGIPVNGMEDNKIYWSNWAGLGDVTRTIQVQRGLGASRLSVASVGGTINIITKTTDQSQGGSVFTTIGNDGFRKTGMTLSTGRTEKGWALTMAGSRTTGDGYIEYNYIDAWSYFFSVSKEINKNHMVMLTGIGAPQRHGQRDFEHGISDQKNKYGTRWNDDSGMYNGKEFGFRENFYHKPQVGLTHSWNISPKTFLSSSAYVSIGRGGGTGDLGGLVREGGDYRGREYRQRRDSYGHFQFDDVLKYQLGQANSLYDTSMVALNYEKADGSMGTARIAANGANGLIKRASMNEHQWYGFLSTLSHDFNDALNISGGLDLRLYTGSHYRKTIDLLGAEYWFDDDNVNNLGDWVDLNGDGVKDPNEMGALIRPTNDANRLWGTVDDNKKIDYHNDENINWYGVFGQVEYSKSKLSTYLSGAVNMTQMRRHDFFSKTPGNQVTDWLSFIGGNVKLGANYNIDAINNVFFNVGYISRAPYFDALYPTFNNDNPNEDAVNEKVVSAELGYGLRTRVARLSLNGYYTQWQDKTSVSNFQDEGGDNYLLNLLGVNALHTGVEMDAEVKLMDNLNITGVASYGDWKWTNDPSGSISSDANEVIGETTLFLDGIKVSDAAQLMMGVGGDWTVLDGVKLDFQYLFYDNVYARYNPEDRDDQDLAGVQALKLPSYGLTDIGATWKFDLGNFGASARLNVNNLFDVEYISDAVDNPDAAISDDRDAPGYQEALDGTRGWFGFGRTWNATLKLNF